MSPTDVDSARKRDSGLTAAVLGFFAAGWFSWTPDASGLLAGALWVGGFLALAVAVVGTIRASRSRSSGVLNEPETKGRYLQVVVAEFVVIGGGAVALRFADAAAFVPVWVCAIVGVHFFPSPVSFELP